MPGDYLGALATRRTATPQREQAHPAQVLNAAGGYTFRAPDRLTLDRFLMLGTQGGTYYTSEAALTKATGGTVLDLCRADGQYVVDRVIEISTRGRALRQNPALFALAAVSALSPDPLVRRAAFDAVPQVARTGSTFKQWIVYRKMFGGWGRGMRRATRAWYTDRPVPALAYQTVKYGQRVGWTDRDVLRLARPRSGDDTARSTLYDWIVGRPVDVPASGPLAVVGAYERAKHGDLAVIRELITDPGLPHEALPSEVKGRPEVWRALLDADQLPPTALLRNLAAMTRAGVFTDGAYAGIVRQRLTDVDRLRRGRIHPIAVLLALRTYQAGYSAQASKSWTPVRQVVDALDAAFYAAFGAVEPTGRRIRVALDVSGSMAGPCAGTSMSCLEAGAAISVVLAATEPAAEVVGFTAADPSVVRGPYYRPGLRPDDPGLVRTPYGLRPTPALTPLDLSPRRRLDDNVRYVQTLPMGATDCSLPVRDALATRTPVDCFVVVTDGETWAGPQHPHEALREYRSRMGIDATMLVLSLTATGTTIADPEDAGMLDVAGLDANVPLIVAEFARGGLSRAD